MRTLLMCNIPHRTEAEVADTSAPYAVTLCGFGRDNVKYDGRTGGYAAVRNGVRWYLNDTWTADQLED